MLFVLSSGESFAQSVSAALNAREAYVGQSIMLTVTVSNTKKYDTPKIPNVDGLDIQQNGRPSTTSSYQFSNGRTSSRSSVNWKFVVTPRREGEFRIPTFDVMVDGGPKQAEPLSIVVTKSETGDLLFVEVEADQADAPQATGYVGQAIQLKLKMWVRPYSDKELEIKLSSANMWQLVSENSSWGVFQERLDQIAQQREQPRGTEVLRKDSKGDSRAYYLYEVESMVYPKRPGKVDVGDVQVIVNYPTALAVSRRRSIFPDDDLFRGSPFGNFFGGNRVSIESYRPISAEATLPPIEVVDVPLDGRPSDYRGAVGKYQIGAQAEPKSVNAGDPITLQLVMQGDGPMELVQAPPFSTLTELTKDFKVADDQLAGFVKDDAKLFTTTIRPLREGITSIPAIPFSFFNPETEQFETVYSNPIPITVAAADTLSLDEIVGGTAGKERASESFRLLKKQERPTIALRNFSTDEVLIEAGNNPLVPRLPLYAMLIAPLAVGICWLVKERASLANRFLPKQTPYQKYVARVRSANSLAELSHALRDEDIELPAALKDIVARCERSAYGPASDSDPHVLDQLKSAAVDAIPSADDSIWMSTQQVVAATLILVLTLGFTDALQADGPETLAREQQQILVDEANALYSAAENENVASKNELIEQALAKYQLVADSGLRSHALYFSLGNAAVQLGDFPQAVAYYEQAQRLAVHDGTIAKNLRFARSKLHTNAPVPAESTFSLFEAINDVNVRWKNWAWGVAAATWIAIWSLLGAALFRIRVPYSKAIASTLGFLFVVAATSATFSFIYLSSFDAIATAEKTELRKADGDGFPIVGELSQCQRVKLLESRGRWLRVRASDSSSEGWAKSDAIFQIRS